MRKIIIFISNLTTLIGALVLAISATYVGGLLANYIVELIKGY